MTAPSVFVRSVFFVILIQLCAFQVPGKRLKKIDLLDQHKFRIPRAEKLRRYMNKSVDPCVDFYEFACGNWQNHRSATENTPITSPMKDLEDTVNKELQVILEDGVKKNDGQVGRKVKDFYASCMNSEAVSRSMKQVFTELVDKNSGMPAVSERWDERNYNWLTQVSNLRKKFGMDILIGLDIKVDPRDKQTSRIYIGEPSTLIPKNVCKESDVQNSRYVELKTEITENMAYWFDLDEIRGSKLATEVLEFETNLCRGMSEEVGSDVNTNITRLSLTDLDSKFPRIIQFYDFVSTSLDQAIYQPVNLAHEEYFHHLSKTIVSTPKRVIANYIMYRALYAISFPQEFNRERRASICVEKCMKHFSKAVGEMYSRENFLSETEDDLRQIWMKLIKAFNTDITSQLWIEENIRRQANYRIDKMRLVFPNYSAVSLLDAYDSVKIERGHFWQNVLSLLELEQKNEIEKLYAISKEKETFSGKEVESFNINVGYNRMQNIVRMPMGLLQPPVYHRTAPYSYKYGILGYFIARELIHGIDENVWHFDENVNLKLLYKERMECFRHQYVSYAGENSSLSPVELDEKIREIIADNGALNISFNAYLQWLQETDAPHILLDETLPNVDYTNTQLLFISFAQNFCTSINSKEEPIGLFPWDVPNYLEKFQVNGILWNMKEFSREFNCLPGTEMNPGDKCTIF